MCSEEESSIEGSNSDYDEESFDEESIDEDVVYGDLKEDNNNKDDLDNDEIEEVLTSSDAEDDDNNDDDDDDDGENDDDDDDDGENDDEEDDDEENEDEEDDDEEDDGEEDVEEDDEFEEEMIKSPIINCKDNKKLPLKSSPLKKKELKSIIIPGKDPTVGRDNTKVVKSKPRITAVPNKSTVTNNNKNNLLKSNNSTTNINCQATAITNSKANKKETIVSSLPHKRQSSLHGRRSNYEVPERGQQGEDIFYNNEDVETIIGLQKLKNDKNSNNCESQAIYDSDLQFKINEFVEEEQKKGVVRRARESCQKTTDDEKGADSIEFQWKDIMEEIDEMKKNDELSDENQLKVEISSTRPSNFTSENNISLKLIKKSSSSNLSKIKKEKPHRRSLNFSNERMREIDRHNLILYKKIISQKPTYKNVTKNKNCVASDPSLFRRLTTSAVNRKKQQQQIDMDNQVLKKRIESISSRKLKFQQQ